MPDREPAPPTAIPEPPGHWEDAVAAEGQFVTTFVPDDPKQAANLERMSYLADLRAALDEVRDQLSAAGPNAYREAVTLINNRRDDKDSEGVARAILAGTRHVRGGAIDKLRALIGPWDRIDV